MAGDLSEACPSQSEGSSPTAIMLSADGVEMAMIQLTNKSHHEHFLMSDPIHVLVF
jgi:hypothetical protein